MARYGGKGVIDHDRVKGLVGAFNSLTQSILRDPRVDGVIAAVESGAREHESLLSLFTNLVSQHKQLLAHVQAPTPASSSREKRPRLEQIRGLIAGTVHLHECTGHRKCTCAAQVRSVIQPPDNEYDDEEEDSPEDEEVAPELSPVIHEPDCPPGIRGKCACWLRAELSRREGGGKAPRIIPHQETKTFSNWDIAMALDNMRRWAARKRFDPQDPLIRHILSVRFAFSRTDPTFSMTLNETQVASDSSCGACGGALHGTGVRAASCTRCLFHPACAAAICLQFGRQDFDRCFGKLSGPHTCSR